MLSQFLASVEAAPIVQSFTSATIVGGTSGTINKPAGTTNGDLLVFYAASNMQRMDTPTGFTSVTTNFSNRRLAYKVAASEPADYTITIASATDSSAVMLRLSKAVYLRNGTNPISSTASPLSILQTNASSSYSLVLLFLSNTSAGITFTVPSQYTSVYSENSAGSVSMAVHKLVVPTSTVPSQNVTMSGGVGGGFQVVFSPT